ncbi:hypothetical protein chiPu_0031160, partial [Chiloscyllium punctatum]|nr:hypothetical protein [Chiloscyllium punctatum]
MRRYTRDAKGVGGAYGPSDGDNGDGEGPVGLTQEE